MKLWRKYEILNKKLKTMVKSRGMKPRDWLLWGIRRASIVCPALSRVYKTGKALVVYWSATGNTEKVALAIREGLKKGGLEPTVKKIPEAGGEELYDYDLVCFGTPVLHALPPPPVMRFIDEKGKEYRHRGEVRLSAPKIPGKSSLVFCTYSGPHTGLNEALPAGKYVRQFFEHLGFDVKGEWYVVGEFHGWKEGSTRGRLGDIRGRPNTEDLAKVKEKTVEVAKSLLK